jgi:hypothetical protein
MANKATKMNAKLTDMLYLISENEALQEFGEASAAIISNPTVVWAKFILTDDMVNGNGQRIPREEFSNLMRTGVFMPVKMAKGEISPGHAGTEPLGSITHLKEMEMPDGHFAIMALAALWSEERPADVQYIKQRFAENKPVDTSWEILYEDSIYNDAHSSIDLLGTILRATTIVGDPAYGARTRVLSVSAIKWSKAYISQLPDSSFLFVNGKERLFPVVDNEGKIDRTRLKDAIAELQTSELSEDIITQKTGLVKGILKKLDAGSNVEEVTSLFLSDSNFTEEELKTLEDLQAQVAELEPKLTEAQEALVTLKAEKLEKEQALADLTEKYTALEAEIAPLREFKDEADAEAARIEKMDAIKAKFTEAGITKEDKYFDENFTKFEKMDDESLEFFLQEVAAGLKSETQSSTASNDKKTQIPNLSGSDTEDLSDPKVLADYLRKQGKK